MDFKSCVIGHNFFKIIAVCLIPSISLFASYSFGQQADVGAIEGSEPSIEKPTSHSIGESHLATSSPSATNEIDFSLERQPAVNQPKSNKHTSAHQQPAVANPQVTALQQPAMANQQTSPPPKALTSLPLECEKVSEDLDKPLVFGIKRRTIVSTLYGLSGAVAALALAQIQPSIEKNEYKYLEPVGVGLTLWGLGVTLEFD